MYKRVRLKLTLQYEICCSKTLILKVNGLWQTRNEHGYVSLEMYKTFLVALNWQEQKLVANINISSRNRRLFYYHKLTYRY